MTCTSPLTLKSKKFQPGYSNIFDVPCGKCMACRIRRTAEWTKRLLDESAGRPACFLTLTYAPENMPADFSLVKNDLQKFIKRLRKNEKCENLKYYAVGEYGDLSNHPHYHGIFIGWRPKTENLLYVKKDTITSKELQNLWPFGFSTTGNADKESIQYVTGYIRKKLYGKENFYGTRTPPFSLSSKNLGLEYAEKNWQRILKGETVNGQNLGIPKYYIKKLATKDDLKMLEDKGTDKEARTLENYENYDLYIKALNSDRARRQAEALSKEKLFNARKKI